MSFFKYIFSNPPYKQLSILYLVAIIVSIVVGIWGPLAEGGDTGSYEETKAFLLQGHLCHARPPLYPLLLAITGNWQIMAVFQHLVFLVSVAYIYYTLKMLCSVPRLVFVTMLVYVCHPAFTYYHNEILPESLCISLGSIFCYYLVRYIKYGKNRDCWLFHGLILCLIFLKPVFLFVVPISAGLFIYLALKKEKRNVLSNYLAAFMLTGCVIGGYSLLMKKEWGVFSMSSISDINLY
jgi:4-amino-4-deoxy-L-arabinose transferase-like glycosyltransferase